MADGRPFGSAPLLRAGDDAKAQTAALQSMGDRLFAAVNSLQIQLQQEPEAATLVLGHTSAMPDVSGINTDHDRRYYPRSKVDSLLAAGVVAANIAYASSTHALVGSAHSVIGITPGHFLKALTSTTFGFAAHGLSYGDVGAAPLAHTQAATTITVTATSRLLGRGTADSGNVEEMTLSSTAGLNLGYSAGALNIGATTDTPQFARMGLGTGAVANTQLMMADVTTGSTDKHVSVRSQQWDSTGEPEGFTMMYVSST